MTKQARPYGSWPSSLSAREVAAASVRLSGLAASQTGLLWLEQRPAEDGRSVIVERSATGAVRDLLPQPYSARSRVHEYGGGAVLAAAGEIFFCNDADQDLYRLGRTGEPQRLTVMPHTRFADCVLDGARNRLIAVAERHDRCEPGDPPLNFLAGVPLESAPAATVDMLLRGADFYATPRLSPDGRRLAFLSWNLPHMPWEAAALHVAPVDPEGRLGAPVHLAGGLDGAAFQPEWAADGTLLFVLEQGEWSNLFGWRDGAVRQISRVEGELLRPLWALGIRSYAQLAGGRIAVIAQCGGEDRLVLLESPANGGAAEVRRTPHRQIVEPVASADGTRLYALVHDDIEVPAIAELDIGSGAKSRILHRPGRPAIAAAALSSGVTLRLESAGRDPVYAVHYPPHSDRFCGPRGELPPLIVTAHGGPTGSADRGLKLKTQFWTSRGFAVLDVDYRGSTGYGRSHRTALDGHWGIRDAEDLADAARAAVARGLADPTRLIVTGGSAGGYTALMALIGSDLFKAATICYGVADLATLLATTHKFEAGYLYGLTGTRTGATEPVFTERSPLAQADCISVPVIFFQGLDDKVVPAEQSRSMVAALKAKGVPVAYLEFAGEGHGFRQAATIRDALLAEYAFYCSILRLHTDEHLPELHIWNWT